MNVPLPRIHDGAVLTGVKAKPSGWPPASPDPACGGTLEQRSGANQGQGSDKIRSLRFQGIAARALRAQSSGGW